MGKLFRVGVLGAGYIADWHCRALRQCPGVQLAAVCDCDLSRAEALARAFAAPGIFADVEAMLAAGGLDAVHVLLPPPAHFAAAERLLQAGVHVLLEKPMCLKADEASRLTALARDRGRALGVSHNFLFAEVYERLRADVAAGALGRLDQVTITWNKPLGQIRSGPFGQWVLREPGNPFLEVGPHAVAHLLDLVGAPDRLSAEADLPADLPTGARVYRRWLVQARRGPVHVDLRVGLGAGFTEHTVHVRGTAGSATADFERNSYVLRRPTGQPLDFDRYSQAVREAASLRSQARRNLGRYLLSKARLSSHGNSFGASIAASVRAFYAGLTGTPDRRLAPDFGAEVVAVCQQIVGAAGVATPAAAPPAEAAAPRGPRVLVLGGAGFIGQALVRQLAEAGQPVRLLLRNPAGAPRSFQELGVEVVKGDLTDPDSVEAALANVDRVVHLARSSAKTWEECLRVDVEGTRRLAEACLRRGVRRLVYTGTIDSYYSASAGEVVTEDTPLDPLIDRRNLYARAKAEAERLLLEMHRDRGLPVVIVRPGVVVGRGGSPFHWGVGMWDGEVVCRTWGHGDHPLPLVLVDDVARGLARVLAADGVDGQSFNLVGGPCLSAREYLAELEKAAGVQLDVRPTPAWRFYGFDMLKWVVKCLVRHPGRRRPSYRDWATRSHRAVYDCSKARRLLGWAPTADRETIVRAGIREPALEWWA